MATAAKPKPGDAERGFTLTREAINVDERRVELAFSSEVPYRRYFGMEVLGHGAKEVDLSRLADGTHPLLWNHDRNVHLGVIESARIDSDKMGRAVVRFAKSAKAEEVFQEVINKTLGQASVSYEVLEWLKIEKKDGEDEWRATKWMPFEISIVTLAADRLVGVGKEKSLIMAEQPDPKPPVDLEAVRKEAREQEQKRTATLFKLGTTHSLMADAQKAIDDNKTVEEFQAFALEKRAERDAEEAKKAKDGKSGNATPPLALSSGIETRENRQPLISIGEAFVRSDAVAKSGYKPGDRINARVSMPDMDSFARATVSISGQSLSASNYVDFPGFVVPDRRMLRVSAIFPSGPISKGSLRFIRESSYANAATRVAEAGTKPAATPALEEVTNNVEKTAVVLKVTDEMFADFEATSGYINNYLTHSVLQLEDEQLLTGTGSSMIYGIHGVTGIGSVSRASYPSVADALNGAIEAVRTNGNTEPNWFVLHPADFHDLSRSKDNNGQYYGGGFFGGAYGQGAYSNVMTLWGIPTLVTSSQTQGQALCGNFSIGAQIFRRTGLTVESTNSNEDDFLNNLVALRAEQRMLLATWKPLAFCEVTDIA